MKKLEKEMIMKNLKNPCYISNLINLGHTTTLSTTISAYVLLPLLFYIIHNVQFLKQSKAEEQKADKHS